MKVLLEYGADPDIQKLYLYGGYKPSDYSSLPEYTLKKLPSDEAEHASSSSENTGILSIEEVLSAEDCPNTPSSFFSTPMAGLLPPLAEHLPIHPLFPEQ